MSRDLTDWLLAITWAYFKPAVTDSHVNDLTTEAIYPVPGGPNDDELIQRALRTRSGAAMFSDGMAFRDLWECNTEKLARKWPGTTEPFDASSADQSLFNRLMWWTGADCPRVERLVMRPDNRLYREKYERPDYLQRTMRKAVSWVDRNPPTAKAVSVAIAAPPPPTAVIPLPPGVPAPPPPPSAAVPALPTMVTNSKDKYEATLDYVRRQLETDGQLSFDDFRGEPMLTHGVMPTPMTDKDYIDLRTAFERDKNFAPVGKDIMRDAVLAESQTRRFDSGIEWLTTLQWDGVYRVDSFLASYCGAEDNDYSRAVSRYMWSGLAGRMMAPGCQLDMVIALQSKQGTKKSTGLKALAPDPDQFTDGLSLHKDDDNFKRLLRGKVIVEIAEMAGLSKGDINIVKRVITRTHEEWIEKYQTTQTKYPRRCMLFASTNEKEFLPPDETGHRRWLPVEITELDRDLIVADRNQLWAEGLIIWQAAGIQYAEAESLAAGRHKKYERSDVWETRIGEWLQATPPNCAQPPCTRPLTLAEVLEGAIKMQPAHMDHKATKRAGEVLRQLGYESQMIRNVRRWVLKAPPPPSAAPPG